MAALFSQPVAIAGCPPIRDHMGEAQSLIAANFSTTGSVERAASEVVLLDTMQALFTVLGGMTPQLADKGAVPLELSGHRV